MVEVNWTVLTYMLIGLFAFSGFFKGWWKEAVVTIFLIFLVFLLQVPAAAQALIDLINFIIAALWGLLSETYRIIFGDFLKTGLGVETDGGIPRIDAGESQTWLIILIIFLGLAILIGRITLPNSGRISRPYFGYPPTFGGSILGGILGGVNGWLIVSLVGAYLNGQNLPGGSSAAATLISPNTVLVQAVDVPTTTIQDSFLPWFFVALGLITLLMAIRSRVTVLKDKEGFRKLDYRPPLGHRKIEVSVSDG